MKYSNDADHLCDCVRNRMCVKYHYFQLLNMIQFDFFLLQDDLTGQAILDLCFARLNLIETAYFGLRYLDDENQTVSSDQCNRFV